MKFAQGVCLVGAVLGVVRGHAHIGDGAEVPLHERVYTQDSLEELERKWSFEVGFFDVLFCVCFVLGRV